MTPAERIRNVTDGVTELHNGDRMSADEFHRIYKDAPEDFKAELVGGVVYVASPLGYGHSFHHFRLNTLLGIYAISTPGVDGGNNATVRLGFDGEPQPDLFLRIEERCGGQSRVEDNFVVGAPELIVEIAHSSWALDLGGKYDDYRRFGVREYLVMDLNAKQIRWFDLLADKELRADAEGVIRVQQFPGLWLNTPAIVGGDFPNMKATLDAGMASEEYSRFKARLAGQ